MNHLIKENYQSNLSIVAWIHDGGHEINSIDLHTQNSWIEQCPDILGISVELNEDESKPPQCFFYSLTMQGNRKLTQCKKPGNKLHNECSKKSLYKPVLEYVKYIEGPLDIVNDVFEKGDDPFEVESNDSETDESYDEDENFWKVCRGCKKEFEDSSKFCNHVSRAKCKQTYGDEWEKWKKRREVTQNQKKQERFRKNNPEKVSQSSRRYYEGHQEEKKAKSKAYHSKHREEVKSRMKNYRLRVCGQFGKRYMAFKKETKDGPIYVCNCCRRTLFKRGKCMFLILLSTFYTVHFE